MDQTDVDSKQILNKVDGRMKVAISEEIDISLVNIREKKFDNASCDQIDNGAKHLSQFMIAFKEEDQSLINHSKEYEQKLNN